MKSFHYQSMIMFMLIFCCSIFGNTQDSLSFNERMKLAKESQNPLNELRLLRNEIFARHGREFSSKDLQDYFSKKKWYKVNPDYSDGDLSGADKKNIQTILKFEKEIKEARQDYASNFGQLLWSDEGKANINFRKKGTQFIAKITTQEYFVTSLYPYNKQRDQYLIVSEIKTRHSNNCFEGEDPYLKATGYLIDDSNKTKRLWTVSDPADASGAFYFYETVQYGCCGASSVNKCYDLLTGELILEHTNNLLRIGIPNSQLNERFVGMKSANTYPRYNYEKDSLYIGTLTYASPKKVLEKYALFAANGKELKERFDFPDGYAKLLTTNSKDQLSPDSSEITLWSADFSKDKKDFKGIIIQIDYITNTKGLITIPIENDAMVVNNLNKYNIKWKKI